MAQYVEVRGQIIEFPDGMAASEIESALKRNAMSIRTKAPDPTEGMSTTDRFLAGAGKAMTDIGRGAGQMLGLVSQKDVDESKQRDAALMKTTAGTVGNVFGNIASTVPLALVPGAATVAGGAAIGGGIGALQPVATGESRGINAGIGAAAGGALPFLMRGLQAGKSLLDPLYQGGRDKIVGNALRSATGGQADDVIRSLQNARPLVPGSMPTVGEAAGNPGLAAMQRTATAVNPTAANEMALRQAASNEARIAAIQGLAPERAAAVSAREAATAPLYDAARSGTVVIDKELAELLKRPAMTSHHGGALTRAQQLAANEGQSFSIGGVPSQASKVLGPNGMPAATTPAAPGELSGKAAHYIKMALDDMSNASPATGIAGNELRAIRDTRSAFLAALEKQIPEYGQARATFASMSKPITQADIAEEILKRSTSNVQGNMTPAAFNRALSDKTAQSVTGQANATLGKAMTPEQMGTLNNVLRDLQALDFSRTAGRGVGSDTVQKLAYTNMLDQAGVPGFIRNMGPVGLLGNIAQRAGQVAYKDANEKLSEQLARAMLSPELAAQLMAGATKKQGLLAIENAIKRSGSVSFPGLLSTYAEQ